MGMTLLDPCGSLPQIENYFEIMNEFLTSHTYLTVCIGW